MTWGRDLERVGGRVDAHPLRATRLRGLLVLAALACALCGATRVVEGRCVAVHDGDTISVLADRDGDADGETLRIRIAGIDTPEGGQPWSSRARKALAARVFGKQVRVIGVAVDGYGRTVGEVYADDVCVGCELVREGHAWVYRRYTNDEVLLRLEAEARARRAGLWSLPESQRVPPWEWRRRDDADADRARPAPKDPACGAKRTCREMESCREARFHLERCGLTRLDGDGDGVPCETLCRGR